jgi:hypothetical protein
MTIKARQPLGSPTKNRTVRRLVAGEQLRRRPDLKRSRCAALALYAVHRRSSGRRFQTDPIPLTIPVVNATPGWYFLDSLP